MAKKKWISKAIKKPGALHKTLGVPAGKKIPASKLAIKPGDSAKTKRRKNLAKTLKKMRKK
jgi:hypothetical protein